MCGVILLNQDARQVIRKVGGLISGANNNTHWVRLCNGFWFLTIESQSEKKEYKIENLNTGNDTE